MVIYKSMTIKAQKITNYQTGWMLWSAWSACTVSCDGGFRERNRRCETGRNEDCNGNAMDTSSCNLQSCPGILNKIWKKYQPSFLIIVCTVFKLFETKCSLLWIAITSRFKENIAWAISYACFCILQSGGHGRIGRLAVHHVAVDPQEELDVAALEIEQIVMVKPRNLYPATKKTVRVSKFIFVNLHRMLARKCLGWYDSSVAKLTAY